jgi:DNA-binding transcriptional regulator YiaG
MDGLGPMTELYHDTNCGLEYVYLRDGYEIHETRHGRGVAIHNAQALHEAIAREVIRRPQRLHGQEVRFLRSLLQLSQARLARVLGTTRLSVARWEARPNHAIPGTTDAALRMFYVLKANKHELAEQICELLTEIDKLEHEVADLHLHKGPRGWELEPEPVAA